jgi:hypothetical protein
LPACCGLQKKPHTISFTHLGRIHIKIQRPFGRVAVSEIKSDDTIIEGVNILPNFQRWRFNLELFLVRQGAKETPGSKGLAACTHVK